MTSAPPSAGTGRPTEALEARRARSSSGPGAAPGESQVGSGTEASASLSVALGEVQLLLAEKRTSLAVLRTGIAVLALPLSVASVLIATSQHYRIDHVLPLLIPLGAASLALAVFGVVLIARSLKRMRQHDRLILEIKRRHSVIAEFIE